MTFLPRAASALILAGLAAASASVLVETVSGQTAAPAARPWSVPRLAGGDPDLEGVWNYGTATPLERPAAVDRPNGVTAGGSGGWEKDNAQRRGETTSVTAGPDWWEPQNIILKNRRTSLIVDPPMGGFRRAMPAPGGAAEAPPRGLREP